MIRNAFGALHHCSTVSTTCSVASLPAAALPEAAWSKTPSLASVALQESPCKDCWVILGLRPSLLAAMRVQVHARCSPHSSSRSSQRVLLLGGALAGFSKGLCCVPLHCCRGGGVAGWLAPTQLAQALASGGAGSATGEVSQGCTP